MTSCALVKVNISKTVTDIYLEQVIVQQHMKEMYYSETKKFLFKNASMYSNQQLATQLEHSLRQITLRL